MSADPNELLTTAEVATEWRVPESTLRSWRSDDCGPKSFRIGRRVFYLRCDVEAWIAEQMQTTAKGGVR